MNRVNKELTQYLVELAVTNPERVSAAVAEVIQYRVMLMMSNFFKDAFEECISTLEKQMEESWDRLKRSGEHKIA